MINIKSLISQLLIVFFVLLGSHAYAAVVQAYATIDCGGNADCNRCVQKMSSSAAIDCGSNIECKLRVQKLLSSPWPIGAMSKSAINSVKSSPHCQKYLQDLKPCGNHSSSMISFNVPSGLTCKICKNNVIPSGCETNMLLCIMSCMNILSQCELNGNGY